MKINSRSTSFIQEDNEKSKTKSKEAGTMEKLRNSKLNNRITIRKKDIEEKFNSKRYFSNQNIEENKDLKIDVNSILIEGIDMKKIITDYLHCENTSIFLFKLFQKSKISLTDNKDIDSMNKVVLGLLHDFVSKFSDEDHVVNIIPFEFFKLLIQFFINADDNQILVNCNI